MHHTAPWLHAVLARIPRIHTHSWEFISQSWECDSLPCMLLHSFPGLRHNSWEFHPNPGNMCVSRCMLVSLIPGIVAQSREHMHHKPRLAVFWYASFPGMRHNSPGNSYQILGNACITLHIALCLVPCIAFLVVKFPGMTVTMLGIFPRIQ